MGATLVRTKAGVYLLMWFRLQLSYNTCGGIHSKRVEAVQTALAGNFRIVLSPSDAVEARGSGYSLGAITHNFSWLPVRLRASVLQRRLLISSPSWDKLSLFASQGKAAS